MIDADGYKRTTVRKAVEQHQRGMSSIRPLAPSPVEDRLPLSLDAYEKRVLERALEETRGDATAAAKKLGIGRSTFYRKLAKHGVRARGAAPAEAFAGAGTSDAIR